MMFAFLALIMFVVALFGGHLDNLNLLYLGLAFLALHLMVEVPVLPRRISRRWRE